jgi:uncharacterized heparinase superfamily protein
LVAGNFLFAGHLLVEPGTLIWDLEAPDDAFTQDLHGFGWLDDLAAVGDAKARSRAQEWTQSWISRYGPGKGPGWVPDLTGRRLMRWTQHALFLLRGQDKTASDAFYDSLSKQTIFLGRRWKTTPTGLPRFQALTGLIYAGLSLEGMEEHVAPAVEALSRECVEQIDDEGGIPTRNPEELLEVFTLLTWAAAALTDSDQTVSEPHTAAIQRIAPTLRALRHSDGGLARFHGGGRGLDGRLDHALAASGVRATRAEGLYMGFARMTAGRTSVVIDANTPPTGNASYNGHASTCAFELTSGRRPLIVSCGSGASFGETWRRAGRATPSHATLGIDGFSSARLGPESWVLGRKQELLIDAPKEVLVEWSDAPDGARFEVAHDGYRLTHGLTHARTFEVTLDGRGIAGEDLLATLNGLDEKRFDAAMDQSRLQGVPFTVRFHLHPDVDATLDMGGSAISIALKSGEIWVFRQDGSAKMALEPSVYLEKGRLRPRGSHQVVLSARAMTYATRVRWSLSKARDTPDAVRDLQRDEAELYDQGDLDD